MQRYVPALLAVLTFCLGPSSVVAQETGKVGLTMGFPGSIGVLWHATDNLAVRPEISFSWSSSEIGSSESDVSTFSTGASVLFYLRKWENLATYASPRYAFARTTSSSDAAFGGESERTSRSHLFSGSFGAQYWLGQRFSAFGELGLAYQRSSSDSNIDVPPGFPIDFSTEFTSTSFGTRSFAGVVFYF